MVKFFFIEHLLSRPMGTYGNLRRWQTEERNGLEHRCRKEPFYLRRIWYVSNSLRIIENMLGWEKLKVPSWKLFKQNASLEKIGAKNDNHRSVVGWIPLISWYYFIRAQMLTKNSCKAYDLILIISAEQLSDELVWRVNRNYFLLIYDN